MRKTQRTIVGVAVALLPLAAAVAPAEQEGGLPPDTVTTVFTSDTIPGYGRVGGVAVDALGYVYVADFQNSVWRVDPQGRVERFADGLYGASGNAVGPRGYLYQSSFNGNSIARISRRGDAETWVDEGLSGPVGIAAAPDGTLFVVNCSGDYVSRVGPDRVARVFAESDLFACPNGITFDDRGDLYIVNFNNVNVVKVTPQGDVSLFTTIPGGGGNGHITFARGGFFVTKFRGEQIYRVGRDGTFSVVAGTGERGEKDGPALEARFSSPNGIAAAPGGNVLWVNDLVGPVGGGPGSFSALRRMRLVTLADVLRGMDADGGVEALRVTYAAYAASRPTDDTRSDAQTLGFQWMSSGRVAEGVALFELNAEAHPGDASSQFNLGEAYRYTGQNEKAAMRYRRALELQPDHPQARARLQSVTGG